MKIAIPEKKVRGVYEKVRGSGVWWIQYFDSTGRRRERIGSKSSAMKAVESRRTKTLEGVKLPENLRAVVRVSDLAPALARDYRVNEKNLFGPWSSVCVSMCCPFLPA